MNYFQYPEKKHLRKIVAKLDTTCGEQRRELGYGVNSTKSLKKYNKVIALRVLIFFNGQWLPCFRGF